MDEVIKVIGGKLITEKIDLKNVILRKVCA
jgi:hypothetical protein